MIPDTVGLKIPTIRWLDLSTQVKKKVYYQPVLTNSPYHILRPANVRNDPDVPDLMRSIGEIGMASEWDRGTKGVIQPQTEVSRVSLCR